MNDGDLIRERLLQAFAPTYLQVIDESEQHIGHAGYQGGGKHFAIMIASEAFKDLDRVSIHRKIYAVLSDRMPHAIHALRITVIKD
ncbi:MAG: hypothetical protein A3F13_08050 [Gammaproteobacteria bacterium RIFCSPHIGHO2_12_FULL_40_19]|nr:MAG: hypothetical protein A3F13_08050 [Gammaproteobacteria bacterium RIFCSPHIGHO2_12_FULL_40_19]